MLSLIRNTINKKSTSQLNRYDFVIAQTSEEFCIGKNLFIEYAKTKRFNLEYQDFNRELEEISYQYGYPTGGLCLIRNNDKHIGCGGIRKFKYEIAELKRMYIKEEFRGIGLGNKLLETLINLANSLGYKKTWLDTLKSLEVATYMYRKRGFLEHEPYRFNPNPDALFLELLLDK